MTSSVTWLMPINHAAKAKKNPTPKSLRSEKEITKGLDEKTANAFSKAYKTLKKYKEDREKKRIKIIDFTETTTNETKIVASKRKCKAKTLSGRPCPFSASYGDYCKKHKQPDHF